MLEKWLVTVVRSTYLAYKNCQQTLNGQLEVCGPHFEKCSPKVCWFEPHKGASINLLYSVLFYSILYNSEEDGKNNSWIVLCFSCLCVPVMDLEEKLHRSEMDRRNSLQRAQLLEGQLQEVRGELSDTLGHLEELRDVLQRTQLTSDQQQAAIDKLATELRWAAPPLRSDRWESVHHWIQSASEIDYDGSLKASKQSTFIPLCAYHLYMGCTKRQILCVFHKYYVIL